MTFAEWMEAEGLTSDAAARIRLGSVLSRSQINRLRHGGSTSPLKALEIETRTQGKISAATLSPEVRLVRASSVAA